MERYQHKGDVVRATSSRKRRRHKELQSQVDRRILAAQTAALMEKTIEFIDSADFKTVSPDEIMVDPRPTMSVAAEQATAPPDTPPYLAALYEFPLLTREQDFQIFRKMNFLRFQAAQLQEKLSLSRLNAERVRRIKELLQEANDVRNRIVQCNLRLVVSIAKTLVDAANSLDDLISEGNFPLIRAVEIFDFTRGLRFSTYATWAVRNGLFRSSSRNRKLKQRFRTDEPDWVDHLPASPENGFDQADQIDAEHWERMVNQLDDRSQTIIRDRFGLGGRPRPAKFRELASKLRLSSERVRQLLERALDQLRSFEETTSSVS
jgi:RNA polymerase sigma factor (sigma-70 family)